MCTETFLRLPEEKRTRFLNAAWEEFTSVHFTDVSINQIVRRAGIPRGSFYQYFSDKDDLLAYLLEEVRNYVKEEYRRVLRNNGGDVFQAQLDLFDHFTSKDPALDCPWKRRAPPPEAPWTMSWFHRGGRFSFHKTAGRPNGRPAVNTSS